MASIIHVARRIDGVAAPARASVVESIARLPVDAELRNAAADAWELYTGTPFDRWERAIITRGLSRDFYAAA
jgi:hypothetical protein